MTNTIANTTTQEEKPAADHTDGSGREETASDPRTDGEASSEPLPLDQVFGILRNQRRRYVLQYLGEQEGQVSLSDLAEQIAAWENGKDVRTISSSERKRVYVGLYQCHLPKMDAIDVVAFNKARGTIELGENADRFYTYLDISEERTEPPWHVYSLALSGAGAVVLATALIVQYATTLAVLEPAVTVLVLGFLCYSVGALYWSRSLESDDDSTGER